ncbi:MAG: glycerol uptake operon antiterminator [Clostridiales bacterium]|nr:glycerol uptake operon antiterminator [Clostridiales bacterium]
MANVLIEGLNLNPIVAAIHHEEALESALKSDVAIVFLLTSNIMTVKETTARIKSAGKRVFIHVDLVEGLSRDLMGLRYICETAEPDGIITTKSQLVKACKNMNVLAIQRIFMIDSHNFDSGVKSVLECVPDAVEILPGIMPTVTRQFVQKVNKPVITGGLITTKEDIINSLNAGASGVSTTETSIWND